MNEAKKGDARMWAKWRRSGAIGTYLDSFLNPDGLPIKSVSRHYGGPLNGQTGIEMGSKLVTIDGKILLGANSVVTVMAPGYEFEVGQVLRRFPDGTQHISEIFPLAEKLHIKSKTNQDNVEFSLI